VEDQESPNRWQTLLNLKQHEYIPYGSQCYNILSQTNKWSHQCRDLFGFAGIPLVELQLDKSLDLNGTVFRLSLGF